MSSKTQKIEGISIRKVADTGEYRVNYIGASERYAAYETDLSAARDTARYMAANRPAVIKPDLRIGKVS